MLLGIKILALMGYLKMAHISILTLVYLQIDSRYQDVVFSQKSIPAEVSEISEATSQRCTIGFLVSVTESNRIWDTLHISNSRRDELLG